MHIAHLINPVAVPAEHPLAFAQQVTFESMRAARRYALLEIQVDLLSAQYPEDHAIRPSDFIPTPDLTRSILDFGHFEPPRKLPLLADILERLYHASEAEYFVYTNVDIGLMPHFYRFLAAAIAEGHDAFTINRRTISARYTTLEALPLMYADLGEPHRGWDCFVFRRDVVPRFALGKICLGAPLVGLTMLANLMTNARQFRQYTREHLTFHLGNDRRWNSGRQSAYAAHNQREALRILRNLDSTLHGFPNGSPPARYLRWQRSPWRAWLYRQLMRIYIPARFTRK